MNEQDDIEYQQNRAEEPGYLLLLFLGCFMAMQIAWDWSVLRLKWIWFRLTVPRECSWCKQPMGITLLPISKVKTHSICPACLARQLKRLDTNFTNSKSQLGREAV